MFDTRYHLAQLRDKGLKYDLEDETKLLNHFWQLTYAKGLPVIYTTIDTKLVHIHRFILNLSEQDGIKIDHRDGNRFNNCKLNLRHATNQQNCMNQKPRDGRKYKGTHKLPSGRYRARVTLDGHHLHLGTFATELEAARAYNIAAVKYYGEFARLNEID